MQKENRKWSNSYLTQFNPIWHPIKYLSLKKTKQKWNVVWNGKWKVDSRGKPHCFINFFLDTTFIAWKSRNIIVTIQVPWSSNLHIRICSSSCSTLKEQRNMTVTTVIKTIQGSGEYFISKLKKTNDRLQLTELLTHFFWGCWEAAGSMVCYCVTVISQNTAEKGAREKEGSNKKKPSPGSSGRLVLFGAETSSSVACCTNVTGFACCTLHTVLIVCCQCVCVYASVLVQNRGRALSDSATFSSKLSGIISSYSLQQQWAQW